ncbi:MAG: ABC transporter ATP-binding protein [Bryobacteraceae bacterium]|nr:ABC transporter ATP-binding protein [Bryobacteraceae bacterium]
MPASVELSGLKFHYRSGKTILDIPALSIDSGERVFVFGPSGSGKTTLLGILAGVLRAVSGGVRVLGRDLMAMSPAQRDAFRGSHIGYIFQLFNLIPYLNVVENIMLPCRLSAERRARLNGKSMDAAAREVAERLGIAGLLDERVTELSVGQQQRVAAARSLIGTPELVIADEPTSSLDHDHRERFIQLLFEATRAAGSTLIFVSHDRTLQPMFDRAIALDEVNLASRVERAA